MWQFSKPRWFIGLYDIQKDVSGQTLAMENFSIGRRGLSIARQSNKFRYGYSQIVCNFFALDIGNSLLLRTIPAFISSTKDRLSGRMEIILAKV